MTVFMNEPLPAQPCTRMRRCTRRQRCLPREVWQVEPQLWPFQPRHCEWPPETQNQAALIHIQGRPTVLEKY